MKRFASIILALALLCALFAACKGSDNHIDASQEPQPQSQSTSSSPNDELPTLRILVDLTIGGDHLECGEIESFLMNNAEGCGTDYQVEVEALPGVLEPDKRNPILTGKHMELLTDAPDVFIMRNFSDPRRLLKDLKNFFPYPTSAMRQRMFLPLDDYVAAYPDWENLRPQVMEAGKLDGSQQLVPLAFKFNATLLDSAIYTPSADLPMTWEQMLDSSDPVLKQAASEANAGVLGVLANYAKEELNFTEEELLDVVNRLRAAKQETAGLTIEEMGLRGGTSLAITPNNDSILKADPEENFYMIPTYNLDGGVTAQVEEFAAISRGTEYPDYAWNILKALLSEEGQRNVWVTISGLPVRMGIGQESTPAAEGWYLDDWDYQQLETLQEQINRVEFITPLSDELSVLLTECIGLDDSQVEAAVHTSYITMKMMLAES